MRFLLEVGLGQRVLFQPAFGEDHFKVIALGAQLDLRGFLVATDVVEQDRKAQQHAQADQLDAVVAEFGELVLGDIAAMAAYQQREHLLSSREKPARSECSIRYAPCL